MGRFSVGRRPRSQTPASRLGYALLAKASLPSAVGLMRVSLHECSEGRIRLSTRRNRPTTPPTGALFDATCAWDASVSGAALARRRPLRALATPCSRRRPCLRPSGSCASPCTSAAKDAPECRRGAIARRRPLRAPSLTQLVHGTLQCRAPPSLADARFAPWLRPAREGVPAFGRRAHARLLARVQRRTHQSVDAAQSPDDAPYGRPL